MLEDYLGDIKESGADTLILGCTHFPLIAKTIAAVLPGLTLINSGAEAAKGLYKTLGNKSESGETKYFVSDNPDNFRSLASLFLEEDIGAHTHKIDIEKY